jgi:hypothetical protein
MRELLFSKKAVPAPSAKNSYMAGGIICADVGATGRRPWVFPVATGVPAGRPCFQQNFSLGSFLIAWYFQMTRTAGIVDYSAFLVCWEISQ